MNTDTFYVEGIFGDIYKVTPAKGTQHLGMVSVENIHHPAPFTINCWDIAWSLANGEYRSTDQSKAEDLERFYSRP